MGSFGEKLRREREMRDITLEEIAEATKIGTRLLRALEEEKFNLLPGGIFNKGFVRAYAKYLGIDEDQAVADYIEASGEQAGSHSVEITQIAEQMQGQRDRERADSDTGISANTFLSILVAIVVIASAAGGYWYWKTNRIAQQAETSMQASAPAPQVQSPTPSSQQVEQPSSTEAAPPSGSAAPEATQADAGATVTSPALDKSGHEAASADHSAKAIAEPITISVKANELAWISVSADGKSIFQQTLKPEVEKTFSAQQRLLFVTGNAGGVEISFNGKPVGKLGAEGTRRAVRFTPEGMERQ